MRKKKISFTHLGCFRNMVDSELMIAKLLEAGFQLTANPKEADLIVVNTCGFLKEAREEALAEFKELFRLKKETARVIAAGCMVQLHRHELKEFPIDAFIGSGDIDKVVKASQDLERRDYISENKSYLERPSEGRLQLSGNGYAFLKIAEGCSKRCSYCIIPKIKGPLKSKSPGEVISGFQALLGKGNFEINLIAQDLGDFGKDRGLKNGLCLLLKEISKLEGDFWARLLYLYPDEVDDELMDILADDSRFCRYIDMPLQHVGNAILKRMKRAVTKEKIIATIEKLRKRLPGIAIRTSFMVGFPGESEADFLELLEFAKEFQLEQAGIFKYSNEELAESSAFDGQVTEELKQERFDKLALVQQKIHEEKAICQIGKKMDVLVTGYHPDSDYLMLARSSLQCHDVDSRVIINDTAKVKRFGSLHPVEITGAMGPDLLAKAL